MHGCLSLLSLFWLRDGLAVFQTYITDVDFMRKAQVDENDIELSKSANGL